MKQKTKHEKEDLHTPCYFNLYRWIYRTNTYMQLLELGGDMVIISNLIVGRDEYGHNIQCGDVCEFKLCLSQENNTKKIDTLRGMIVYDEDSYAFAFVTLDSRIPLVLMKHAELNSIHKLFDSVRAGFDNISKGDRWREIYMYHVMV